MLALAAPPPMLPEASQATVPFSSTSTSTPARASHHPALSPVTPPPMITTAAPFGFFMADPSSFIPGRLDKARLQFHQLAGGDVAGDPVAIGQALHRRRRVVADG